MNRIVASLQRIFDTENIAQANLIVSILAAKGIHPPRLRTVPRFTPAGVEIFYAIEVPLEQVAAADAVLRPYGYISRVG
jgi:hypothetical protein